MPMCQCTCPYCHHKGVVPGETIIGANMFKDFFAGIRDIVGGRAGANYFSVKCSVSFGL